MTLELSNGAKIDDPSETQIRAALTALDGVGNNMITLHSGVSSSLCVVRDSRPRFYFYLRHLTSQHQAVQPVSQYIALKILAEYAKGSKTWKKTLRFEKVDLSESDGLEIEPVPIDGLSDSDLVQESERIKKTYWWAVLPVIVLAVLTSVLVGDLSELRGPDAFRFGVAALGLLALTAGLAWRHRQVSKEVAQRRNEG